MRGGVNERGKDGERDARSCEEIKEGQRKMMSDR